MPVNGWFHPSALGIAIDTLIFGSTVTEVSNQLRRLHSRCRRQLSLSGEMLIEEAGQLVEWNYVHLVIEINVVGTGDNYQFLRFGGVFIGVFAEVARMSLFTVDQ